METDSIFDNINRKVEFFIGDCGKAGHKSIEELEDGILKHALVDSVSHSKNGFHYIGATLVKNRGITYGWGLESGYTLTLLGHSKSAKDCKAVVAVLADSLAKFLREEMVLFSIQGIFSGTSDSIRQLYSDDKESLDTYFKKLGWQVDRGLESTS